MRWIIILSILIFQLSFSAVNTMLFLTQGSSPDTEENNWITEFQKLGLTVTTQQVSSNINIGNKDVLAMAYDFSGYYTVIMNVMNSGHPLLLLGISVQVCDDLALYSSTYKKWVYGSGAAHIVKRGDYADILSDYEMNSTITVLDRGVIGNMLVDYTKFVGVRLASALTSGDDLIMGVCDPNAHQYNGNNGFTGPVKSQVCVFGHSCGTSAFTADFEKIFKRVFNWFTYKPTSIVLSSFGDIKALYK
jgi:hypothetical protein